MDDLLTDFIAETRDMMEAIESEIIAWEANPGDKTRLDAIFRFVHTVKGNCGFFDFPRLERLSHAAEDALADVRAGHRETNKHLVSTILAIIDCICAMVSAIEAGEEFPEGKELELIAALDQDSAGEAPTIIAPKSDGKPGSAATSPRSIRLPVDLLDRVMSGVSDMVLARNDLAHRLKQTGNQPAIDGPFERLTAILNDVRDAITRMRMQRVEQLFNTIPRLVRDLSQELGKQVLLDIEGGDVELDREVIEVIRDPITHIIRNSLDHGIESPAKRMECDKDPVSFLRIAARQTGNRITIVISDDGCGLDEENIARKALANGLITQKQRDAMDSHAIHQLVFEPGLSTASQVSNISGRGVGLDVVRDNLERVGGWIEANSTAGQGTSIFLHIPLTLSIIGGLTVEAAGQQFAIPQSYVEEVDYGSGEGLDYTQMGNAALVTMRGQRVPCLSLSDVLGLEAAHEQQNQTYILLRLAKGDAFALSVDRIHNIGDIVVKPLPPALLEARCYSGIALLDDGQPILLLDLPQIAIAHDLVGDGRNRIDLLLPQQDKVDDVGQMEVMLFTGHDGKRMAARLELIKRIETIRPDAIELSSSSASAVIDGQILPVTGLPDHPITASKARFLNLSDGDNELLYAVSDVDDALTLPSDISRCDNDPLIEGLVLVEDQCVGLLDGHALFQAYGANAAPKRSLICSLPDNDWSRNILAPLVISAGYDVAYESDKADISVALDAKEQSADATNTHVIHLRSAPDASVEESVREHSIYRYDRHGLLKALRNAAPKQVVGGDAQ